MFLLLYGRHIGACSTRTLEVELALISTQGSNYKLRSNISPSNAGITKTRTDLNLGKVMYQPSVTSQILNLIFNDLHLETDCVTVKAGKI